MRHVARALIGVFLVALPAVALEIGQAEGNLTIDGKKFPLTHAYAVAKQKNQLNDRNELTRIILSDQPLPDGAKLAELDDHLPGDVNGVIISVDKQGRVAHVAVQHPSGNYDGGYFEGIPDYEFKLRKSDPGTFAGNASSLRVKTNTMTFSFDATFSAALR